jgi:hypothetical protein
MRLMTGPKHLHRLSLSATRGGEGRGEVGEQRAAPAGAHLTLPLLRNGALPLPPKDGEGRMAV